jgi:hypothetical protein
MILKIQFQYSEKPRRDDIMMAQKNELENIRSDGFAKKYRRHDMIIETTATIYRNPVGMT